MVKYTIILTVLYFLQFYLTNLRGKEYYIIMPTLTNSQEPEPLEKKIKGAGAAREKNQEPEPLEKKSNGKVTSLICKKTRFLVLFDRPWIKTKYLSFITYI